MMKCDGTEIQLGAFLTFVEAIVFRSIRQRSLATYTQTLSKQIIGETITRCHAAQSESRGNNPEEIVFGKLQFLSYLVIKLIQTIEHEAFLES